VTRAEIEAAEAEVVVYLTPTGGEVFPGPGAVGLLERLADRILGPT
jgi:hypothetical protein